MRFPPLLCAWSFLARKPSRPRLFGARGEDRRPHKRAARPAKGVVGGREGRARLNLGGKWGSLLWSAPSGEGGGNGGGGCCCGKGCFCGYAPGRRRHETRVRGRVMPLKLLLFCRKATALLGNCLSSTTKIYMCKKIRRCGTAIWRQCVLVLGSKTQDINIHVLRYGKCGDWIHKTP